MNWLKTIVGAGSRRRSKSCHGVWIVGIGLAMSLSVGVSGAEDWPHYLGPNFDLAPSVKEFNAKSATKLWDAKVGIGMCSVTISDGLLYTMGNDANEDKSKAKDTVYCLDVKTGAEKWTFDYECVLKPNLHPGGPSSTPTIHQGRVYTISKEGHIFCLDAKTGEKIWEASAQQYQPRRGWWGFAASPTIVGDAVVYNVGDRGLALNKNTGDVLWKSEQSVVAYATPKPLPAAMFNRPAVALLTNRQFLVLDPKTGRSIATYEKKWQEKSNCNGTTPYIHNGRIYTVHSAHGLSRLSISGDKLTQDWLSEEAKFPNEWFSFNTHVIHEGSIYFLTKGRGSSGMGLSRVDAETGELKSFDGEYAFGNLLAVGDKLIMLSETGELIWGNLGDEGFRETHRQKILHGLCWSKPILLSDRLYARDAQGTVVCVELK
ncbi:MAG: PQQ-like beta-propeller repeat protein [Phycisphaerales bacterium]|nr:MAG: PQQ-like beta-propeller repeat protein [Phycisphaerales bacterium]